MPLASQEGFHVSAHLGLDISDCPEAIVGGNAVVKPDRVLSVVLITAGGAVSHVGFQAVKPPMATKTAFQHCVGVVLGNWAVPQDYGVKPRLRACVVDKLQHVKTRILDFLRGGRLSRLAMLRGQRKLVSRFPLDKLTALERETLTLFARGRSYTEIAEARGNTTATVRNTLYRIQDKLGIGTKQELVVWAVRNGLVDDGVVGSDSEPAPEGQ